MPMFSWLLILQYSDYYRTLVRRGIFNSYILEYGDAKRTEINSQYKTFDDFKKRFVLRKLIFRRLFKKGEDAGVKYDEASTGNLKVRYSWCLKHCWRIISGIQTNISGYHEKDNVIAEALKAPP